MYLLFCDKNMFLVIVNNWKSLFIFTTKTGIIYLEKSVFVTFILHVSTVVIIHYLLCVEMLMTVR